MHSWFDSVKFFVLFFFGVGGEGIFFYNIMDLIYNIFLIIIYLLEYLKCRFF